MRTTKRFPIHACVRAAFLLGPLALSGAAGAQDIATAAALFDSGFADMKAGRYDTGCKAIAESQRLEPRLSKLVTLATCEKEWGHLATAVTRYSDFISAYEHAPASPSKDAQATNYELAKKTRDELSLEVPQLTLSLPTDAPAGTIVMRDGQVVPDAALGLAIPVDPGSHVISTQAPGGPLLEQSLTLVKGEKKQVTVKVRAGAMAVPASTPTVTAPPPPSGTAGAESAPPVNSGPSGRRVATYVIGGVGLAGLVVGGVMGGLAAGQKGAIDQHCGAAIGQVDKRVCDPTGLDAASSAKSMAMGSTIGLALGGAAAATALVLLFTEPKARSAKTGSPARGPVGPWMSVGVLSVGPAGGTLGAHGGW